MMPVDIYVGGMEHAIMHLLYARFVHKFSCDYYGIPDSVESRRHSTHSNREPFKELIVQGLVKSKTFQHNGRYVNQADIDLGLFTED